MRSARLLQILSGSLCLLVVASLASVACTKDAIPAQVPDLVGLQLDDAEAQLQALGLSIVSGPGPVTLDPSMDFIVVDQQPEPGTWVNPFSLVYVTWARLGYETPDVLGMTEADAQQVIMTVFQTGPGDVVYVETPDMADWGIVMAQTPAPGVLTLPRPPFLTSSLYRLPLPRCTSPPLLPLRRSSCGRDGTAVRLGQPTQRTH